MAIPIKTGVRLRQQLVANRHPSRKHTTHYDKEREYKHHSLKLKHLATIVIPIRGYKDRIHQSFPRILSDTETWFWSQTTVIAPSNLQTFHHNFVLRLSDL